MHTSMVSARELEGKMRESEPRLNNYFLPQEHVGHLVRHSKTCRYSFPLLIDKWTIDVERSFR